MSSADINAINQVLGNIQSQINEVTGNTLSNYNQLSRIVAQQGNIYNTIYYGLGNLNTGNLTVNSSYTINGNLTYSNLNFTGNLALNNGNLLLPNGNLFSTLGNIVLNNGNILSVVGNLILNNGNLGIGTTNPQSSLSVSGNAVITGNVNIDNGLIWTDPINNRVGINNTNPQSSLSVDGNAVITGNLNVDNGLLWTNPVNNRIGINNTNPLYEFDVKGDANITGNLLSAGVSTILGQAPFIIQYGITASGTSGTVTFGTSYSATPTILQGWQKSSAVDSVYMTAVSATGFTWNATSATIVHWLAIGLP